MKTYLAGFALALMTFAPTVQAALDVITTFAQRRAQNVQDVPIAVTAFTGEDLERSNIKGAIDYLNLTPNVSFTDDGQAGKRGLGIAIRGINSLVSGENAFVNSVGIYLDEFSVASVPNQVANPQLPDMQSIEVLRGPQGTYFGRNSLGGALNLKTASPTDEVEGKVSAGFETYEDAGETFTLTGVGNWPVSDNFKFRGVVQFEDSSGKVDNITPGGEPDSGHQYLHLRGKADWQITDDTSALFTVIWTDEEQGTDETVPSGVLDIDSVDSFGLTQGVDPGTGFWPLNRNRKAHDARETNELDTLVAIVNLQHQLTDDRVIKWITGLIDSEQTRAFDNDLLPVAILQRDNLYEGTSYSTELRIEDTGENIDWVAGILYAQDEQDQDNLIVVGDDPTGTLNGQGPFFPPLPPGLMLVDNQKVFEVDSIAAFADVTWRINEQFELIVGARYTSDDVTNGIMNVGRPEARNETSFDDISPRLVGRYKFNDDVSVYASISKGYKAGGTSVGNDTNQPGDPPLTFEFKEEIVWNYELGMKAELLDSRLRLNGSIFMLDWEDLQVEAFRFLTPGDLTSNFEETQNVDDAEALGIEVEFLASLSDELTLGGGLGYLDTEITCACSVVLTSNFMVDLEGLDIPKAPELSFNLFGEYRTEVGDNEWWGRVEFIHRDGQYSDVEGLTNAQTQVVSPNGAPARVLNDEFPYRSPDYDIVNLRAGVEVGESWSFGVYIQNATDEEYYTGTQENFGLSGIRIRPHPRVLGGNATFRF